MIQFTCSQCGRLLQARDEDVGKKAKCPSCAHVQAVAADPVSQPEAIQTGSKTSPRSERRARDEDRDDRDDERDDRGGRGTRRRRSRSRDDEETPTATSGKAMASLILGFLSCLVLPGIIGVILGMLALRDIKNSRGALGGKGLATAGLIVNCIGAILAAIGILPVLLLMPAVSKVREAASRAQDANNMKQFAIAFHNMHDTYNALPAATAYVTRDGKPGLSWRVAILPYVEQDHLFRQFRIDEPWDSPHNSSLIPQMPKIYQVPGQPPNLDGKTHYQVFVGKGSLFEVKKGAAPPMPGQLQLGWKLFEVTDGTSNTVMLASGRDPVIWTKPEDLPFDPAGPLPALGGQFTNVFNVAFADGSVRALPLNIAPETLKAAITRNGGEIINLP